MKKKIKNKIYCRNCKWFDPYSYMYIYNKGACEVFTLNKDFTEVRKNCKGNKYFYLKNEDMIRKELKRLYKIKDKRNRIELDLKSYRYVDYNSVMNINFDCKFYKRKWWKVWLKK